MNHPISPSPSRPCLKLLGLLSFAVLVVMLLLGALLASPALAGVDYSTEEIAFAQLINQYRAGLGLDPLLVSDVLSDSGDKHDSDMAKYGFFSHYTQASDWFDAGDAPWDRMRTCGYDHNSWMGENIAAGYATAAKVFAAWRDSPDHNQNMVNPNFKVIGVSFVYVSGSTYKQYWTTDFGGYVDSTAHSIGSPASTTTTVKPTTTTTARPATTTTVYIAPTTTTTTTYVPPTTTTTTARPTTTTTTRPATSTTVPSMTFSDVGSGTRYADQILHLAGQGIVTGYVDGRFGPYDPVTRQQFAKMIILTLGYTVSPVPACGFKDVPLVLGSSDPLYPASYIAACASAGITVGKTADTFGPYDRITRAQLITMVARAANLPEPPYTYQPSFAGFSASHYPWARKAAYAGLLDGLVGMGPGFDFCASATRGEVCLLLAALLGG